MTPKVKKKARSNMCTYNNEFDGDCEICHQNWQPTSSKFQFLSMDSNLHEQITKINKHSIDKTLKIHNFIA